MGQETKLKIIETGARIIHKKGFNHTGIQEVLDAAGVPKGSFYFYFKNKEDFGLHVIDFFNNMFFEMIDPIVKNKDEPAVKRIELILNMFIELFKELHYTCGCPIGNLSQELGDLSTTFSCKLESSVNFMAKVYEDLLEEAKLLGEVKKEMDSIQTSCFIVSSWHGALIRMKVIKTTEPLETHKHFILKILSDASN